MATYKKPKHKISAASKKQFGLRGESKAQPRRPKNKALVRLALRQARRIEKRVSAASKKQFGYRGKSK